MSSPRSLPEDPVLAEVAEQLHRSRWAAVICDAEWRLVWVSEEMKVLLDEDDEAKIGYGKHLVAAYATDTWAKTLTEESQLDAFAKELPILLAGTPGGKEGMLRVLAEAVEEGAASRRDGGIDWSLFSAEEAEKRFLEMEPVTPPPVWTTEIDFVQRDLPPVRVTEFHIRIFTAARGFAGTVLLYGSALPARVLAYVARGDEGMFTRMARLFDAGRRPAAIVFADLQSSGVLSRRLPSAAYFRLLRAFTTSIDDVVIRHQGIVGKHAGDGVTAFFLSADLGSNSKAAAAAISAARDIAVSVRDVAKEMSEVTGLIDSEEVRVNVGAHWGGALYIGQLVTGGRLEVTALGDEVNECARVQQSARDGAVLASKALVERLDDHEAAGLGLDPDGLVYRTLAEVPGAPEKAVRDAGRLPVTSL